MIITVFGATGQVGKRIVRYALAKGNIVRAFGRNVESLIDEDNASIHLEAIKGSVFDDNQILGAITGTDAVLSALGGSFDGVDKTRSLGIKKIVQQMANAGVKRIVAVGGMGVLSDANNNFIMNSPEYPPEYLAVGEEHLQAFHHFKNSKLDWTFVCPPNIKDEDATGSFNLSDTYPPTTGKGEITAGDLAHFMVNEAWENKHLKQRVGINNV